MNKLEQIYCDLTGTPYFKVQLMSHNHIMDILSFKPDEIIFTSYGRFKSPEDRHKVYYKNNYYITYDITDFKPLEMIKESNKDKIKRIAKLKFNDIAIEYLESEDKNKQTDNEPLVYIDTKISPKEFEALLESESTVAVSKPQKKDGSFDSKYIIYIVIALGIGFVAFNYFTKGRMF